MKTLISTFSWILIFILAVPAGLSSQIPARKGEEWIPAAEVPPAAFVLVKMKNGETVKGKLNDVSTDAVSLSSAGRPVKLEKEEIATVWRLSRSLKKPVLVGTAIGAGAGAALGIAAGGCSPNDVLCFDRKATIPIGAAFFGFVGAISGLVFGLAHHHKVVVYQASN
jgi:hypothetical protein